MTHHLQAPSPLKKRVTAVLAAMLIEAALFWLSAPAADFGAGMICILFGLPFDGEAYRLIFDLLYMPLYAVTFLLPASFLIMLLRGRFGEYLRFKPRFEVNPALAAAVTLGVVTAVSYLSNLYISLLDVLGIRLYYSESPFPESTAAIIVYFLSSVVVPAFVEEITYRGAVLHALLPFGRWFAIIASGILFGVMHYNPSQILYAAAAGMALAYFVLEAKSLWMGIAIHALNNALSFFGHWLYDCVSEEAYYRFYSVFDAVIVTLALAGILIILHRRTVLRRYEERPAASLREMAGAFISPVGAAYAMAALLLTARWC